MVKTDLLTNIKAKIFYLTAVGVGIFLLFFVIACTWIGYDVKDQCKSAEREYGNSSCVEALSRLLDDETRGYRARNDAVWALGQLGDSRALPVLKKYYTGNIPEREPLDETISQYELKKAINLAQRGTNLTAVFWRYNLSD